MLNALLAAVGFEEITGRGVDCAFTPWGLAIYARNIEIKTEKGWMVTAGRWARLDAEARDAICAFVAFGPWELDITSGGRKSTYAVEPGVHRVNSLCDMVMTGTLPKVEP